MKAGDLLELAGRNLRESILRNSLTTAGISIGVASLLTTVALGIGLQELANRHIGQSGLFDTVYVTSMQDGRGGPDDDAEQPKPKQGAAPAKVLDENARQLVSQVPGVSSVDPEVRFMGDVRTGTVTANAPVGGEVTSSTPATSTPEAAPSVTPNAASAPAPDASHATFVAALPMSSRRDEAFENMKGHYFSRATAAEAIVSNRFAKEVDEKTPGSIVGKTITVQFASREPLPGSTSGGFSVVRKNETVTVVGLIESEPFGGMRRISGAGIFVPTAITEGWNVLQTSDFRGVATDADAQKTYPALLVQVATAGKVPEVQEAIKKLGFRTFSILDATKGLRRFFGILDIFLGIFGSLALIVASLAIINTLIMSVLERTREIGIMKAIGASDGDVKTLFFTEAGAMGLVGGFFGVLLGLGIGALINFGTNLYLTQHHESPDQVWSSPWWLVLFVMAFSIGLSFIAGLYPAARAAKLDPVQALRYE